MRNAFRPQLLVAAMGIKAFSQGLENDLQRAANRPGREAASLRGLTFGADGFGTFWPGGYHLRTSVFC